MMKYFTWTAHVQNANFNELSDIKRIKKRLFSLLVCFSRRTISNKTCAIHSHADKLAFEFSRDVVRHLVTVRSQFVSCSSVAYLCLPALLSWHNFGISLRNCLGLPKAINCAYFAYSNNSTRTFRDITYMIKSLVTRGAFNVPLLAFSSKECFHSAPGLDRSIAFI